jgi:hypothetical protein
VPPNKQTDKQNKTRHKTIGGKSDVFWVKKHIKYEDVCVPVVEKKNNFFPVLMVI